tara:strand:- start:9032 stop:9568 length:537 start_codon:yes stop_codon:yes gene_type:complete
MKETGIDSMKYRKSTHLAGVDVEMIIAEKGNCILKIKEAYYSRGVNVSGTKTDGYFVEFEENVKPMMLNSGNRKTIGSNVKLLTECTGTESRNIANWVGVTIELYFDESVKMMNKVTGGIRVSTSNPIPNISDVNAKLVLNASKNLIELSANWSKLSKKEQALPTINALKDNLKNKLA